MLVRRTIVIVLGWMEDQPALFDFLTEALHQSTGRAGY
jgi:hypothetical protein